MVQSALFVKSEKWAAVNDMKVLRPRPLNMIYHTPFHAHTSHISCLYRVLERFVTCPFLGRVEVKDVTIIG
jgi:hypothetical protein